MEAEERESGRGFRVQDRRRFSSSTGESLEGETSPKKDESLEQNEQSTKQTMEGERAYAAQSSSHDPISFSGFLLGLTTQALMFLGEIDPPPGQTRVTDLSAARQMIDLLAMLKEKTKGNLEEAEAAMLENALFDLRIRYVEIAKK